MATAPPAPATTCRCPTSPRPRENVRRPNDRRVRRSGDRGRRKTPPPRKCKDAVPETDWRRSSRSRLTRNLGHEGTKRIDARGGGADRLRLERSEDLLP